MQHVDGARPVRRPGPPRAVVAVLVALAVGVVGVVGILVVRPGWVGADTRRSSADAEFVPTAGPSAAPVDPRLATIDDLLGADRVTRPPRSEGWRQVRTDDNTAGDGLRTLCQQQRFADPRGLAALVRRFQVDGPPRRTLVQQVEVSRSARAAARGYRTALGWYADCRVARLQLLGTYRVDGVGDRATVLVLRHAQRPWTRVSVGLARTRSVTTSVVHTAVGDSGPGPRAVTLLLARATSALCARSGAPACVRTPTLHRSLPPRADGARGVLAVPDLPPVGDVDHPWVGTDPEPLSADRPATTCDRVRFPTGARTHGRTRTFLVPQADLPARFGLSETAARFPTVAAARDFEARVRRDVAGCEDRDLATRVGAERRLSRPGPTERAGAEARAWAWAWDVTTQVAQDREVRFRLGLVRVGRSVARLTFTPTDGADLTRAAYDALLLRAGDRLRELR